MVFSPDEYITSPNSLAISEFLRCGFTADAPRQFGGPLRLLTLHPGEGRRSDGCHEK
jgi:hypothetical protein